MKSYSKRGALLSALFMGLGQLYHKQFAKGIIFLLLELYLVIFYTPTLMHGVWGLVTLGTKETETNGLSVVMGDHSVNLMIDGLIIVISFLLFLWFYIMNVIDAYRIGKARELGIEPNKTKAMLKNIIENSFPVLLVTPSVVFTAFLTILPLLFSVLLAFTDYSAPNHLPPEHLVHWVGLQTFKDLFQMDMWSGTFFGVFKWTVIWAILATVTTFFTGLLFAVFINARGIVLKRFWRSIFILPWAVPQLISILIMVNIFNGTAEYGLINGILHDLHLPIIPFLSDPTWAKVSLIIVNIWFGFPYWTVLMSGVMTSIDKELYEAADVDGANSFQKFFNITLPMVMYSTMPLLVMSFAGNFNNFNVIYLFTGGNPPQFGYQYAGSTDILISWIYKLTLNNQQYNMASVVSILIFVIIASLSIWQFSKTKAFKEEDTN